MKEGSAISMDPDIDDPDIDKFAALLGGGRRLTSAAEDLGSRLYRDAQQRPERARRIAGLVVLGLVLVTALLGYQARQYQLTSLARGEAITAAKDSVIGVLSYNYRTIDRQLADTQGLLTGNFKDEYVALVRDVVAKSAKDTQVAIQTAVVNESVVSSQPDHVVLLLFVNQQATTKANREPVLTASRIRVTLEHRDDKWLISELTPV